MCNVKLTLLDLDTGSVIVVESDYIIIENNEIVFANEHLSAYRHYNVSIVASNLAGSAISYFTLSEYSCMKELNSGRNVQTLDDML